MYAGVQEISLVLTSEHWHGRQWPSICHCCLKRIHSVAYVSINITCTFCQALPLWLAWGRSLLQEACSIGNWHTGGGFSIKAVIFPIILPSWPSCTSEQSELVWGRLRWEQGWILPMTNCTWLKYHHLLACPTYIRSHFLPLFCCCFCIMGESLHTKLYHVPWWLVYSWASPNTLCTQIKGLQLRHMFTTYVIIPLHLLMQKLRQLIQLTEKQSLYFPTEKSHTCRKHAKYTI